MTKGLVKGYDMVLAGVGGQGILLAGRIICRAAMDRGYTVNSFESHGMAQRGGAVLNQIRWGTHIHSSLILEGEADLMVSLEPVEALRRLPLLGKGTTVIMNTKTIPPITVSSVPGARYPTAKEVAKALRPHVAKVITLDGTDLAGELGNTAVLSTVMIGAAWGSKKLPIKKDLLVEAIRDIVPERHLELNMSAFNAGVRAIRKR